MATEFVRARDPKTKHEVSVTRRFAEAYKLDILDDKDATNSVGRPLPGKPHVELKKAAGDGDQGNDPAAGTGSNTTTGSGRQNGGSAR